MTRTGQVTLNFDKKFRRTLKSRFGTDENEKIKQIVLDYLKNGDTAEFLSAKERKEEAQAKIAEAKANLVNENEKLKNEKLDLEVKILRRTSTYQTTFDSDPSDEAEKAIKKGITQRELTNQEFENVSKYITVRKDSYNSNKWVGKCDICKEGESYETHYELINDMIRHLSTEHSKKVMEIRN